MHHIGIYFRGRDAAEQFVFKDSQICLDFQKFLSGRAVPVKSYQLFAVGAVIVDLREVVAIHTILVEDTPS